MKTIDTKMPFGKSVPRWAALWLLMFALFAAPRVWLRSTVLAQTSEPYTFTTLAGNAGYGNVDGTGSDARFAGPSDVAVDSAGNVYVADTGNNTIRKGIPANSILAPMLMPPSLSTRQFGFGITGLPGLVVEIESSTD